MTNIKDHKWSSRWIAEAWGDEDGNLVFNARLSDDYQAVNKQDVIAMAEHFGLATSDNSYTRWKCTKCGSHLGRNSPLNSCLCKNALNIVEA